MVELTFAERWKKNHLPGIDYTLVKVSLCNDINCSVNGLSLPCDDSIPDEVAMCKMILLTDKNSDWVPFFSSATMADKAMVALGKTVESCDPTDSYGFLFSPRRNSIFLVAVVGYDDNDAPITGYYKLCDFHTTTRSLMHKIAVLGKSGGLSLYEQSNRIYSLGGISRVVLVDRDDDYGDWGDYPSRAGYLAAKKAYEQMYRHSLSDVPNCFD